MLSYEFSLKKIVKNLNCRLQLNQITNTDPFEFDFDPVMVVTKDTKDFGVFGGLGIHCKPSRPSDIENAILEAIEKNYNTLYLYLQNGRIGQ